MGSDIDSLVGAVLLGYFGPKVGCGRVGLRWLYEGFGGLGSSGLPCEGTSMGFIAAPSPGGGLRGP